MLAAFVFPSGGKRADASPPSQSSPLIVAKVNLTGQTTVIPSTTLFTPKVNGLFRISVYMTMTAQGNDGGAWDFSLNWADDAGAEALTPMLELNDQSAPPFAYGYEPSQNFEGTFAFRANAGTPVTYTVNNFNFGRGDGTYEVFVTVERLE
jgi:hypothetical protein